jgi:SAM-dependent methyltransferase
MIADLPGEIASFTLGCGDPITLASLQPGETVLDLGSGGGLDCFLAAKQVGPTGHVIGVDMTPEMLAKARANAAKLNAANVEFREGYLEKLPVEDASVDVVISNCVINLSPDKQQVFREVYRVLRSPDPASGKPGGRVAVSDIVTNGALPDSVQKNMEAWGACVAGALDQRDYVRGLSEAGFANVQVQPKSDTDKALAALPVGVPFSATVTAVKTGQGEGETRSKGEEIECSAPGGSEARLKDSEALLSRIVNITPIADGYEFLLTGDPAETRALAEAFIREEAACCSFLHFDLAEVPGGLRLRLASTPAGVEFAKEAFSQAGTNVKWLSN